MRGGLNPMQATVASNHQRRLFFSGGWFAIDPPIRSGTARLGNDFVPPVAGRSNQPSAAPMQHGLATSTLPIPLVLVVVLVIDLERHRRARIPLRETVNEGPAGPHLPL